MNKILSIEQLENLLDGLKVNDVLVCTAGTFDLFHYGHLQYLQKAKKLGDVLLVLLNSDDSIRAIKGPEKPFNSEYYRAEMLAALECVDYIYIFDQTTPSSILEVIKPNYYVKGSDYSISQLPEAQTVEDYGGEVKLMKYTKPHVTITKVKFFT